MWQQIWEKLKRVPVGLWAALGVALALLGLYLRGRRLDAELAKAKLERTVADSRATTAKDQGRAEVYQERVRAADRRIEGIRSARDLAVMAGAAEEKRLAALKPDRVHEEYLKLLERKRSEAGFDASLARSMAPTVPNPVPSLPPDIGVQEHLEIEKKKKRSPVPYED